MHFCTNHCLWRCILPRPVKRCDERAGFLHAWSCSHPARAQKQQNRRLKKIIARQTIGRMLEMLLCLSFSLLPCPHEQTPNLAYILEETEPLLHAAALPPLPYAPPSKSRSPPNFSPCPCRILTIPLPVHYPRSSLEKTTVTVSLMQQHSHELASLAPAVCRSDLR
jgi:hypothetical protein